MTKPEYAQKLEPFIIRAGRSGQQINDDQFKQLLQQFSQQAKPKEMKVNFTRRTLDSDDDDDDF